MKSVILVLSLLFPFFAQAGQLIWVDSQSLTSFDYKYGDSCDKVTLGTKEGKFTFTACGGQAIVKDHMDRLLTSPNTEQCVKTEYCNGQRCSRTFGTRQVTTRLLLIVTGSVIDSFKAKYDVGPCR